MHCVLALTSNPLEVIAFSLFASTVKFIMLVHIIDQACVITDKACSFILLQLGTLFIPASSFSRLLNILSRPQIVPALSSGYETGHF